jgi:hypothetical protein
MDILEKRWARPLEDDDRGLTPDMLFDYKIAKGNLEPNKDLMDFIPY